MAKIEIGFDEEATKLLTDLVSAITGAETGTSTAAKGKNASKKKDEPSGPTREDVRAKLKAFAAIDGKEAAIKILNDHGAASISELDEDKFAEVIEACDK